MSQVSRATSKTKFETGDVPTQADFGDLHDSVAWYDEAVKATASDLNTGTDDAKFATSLALEGSKYLTQAGGKISATASGTDTYTATIAPAITAYAAGQRFFITFTNANTGAATINLNSQGAKSLKKNSSAALTAGDILAGQIILIAYDGTNFQIIGTLYDLSTYASSTEAKKEVIAINCGDLTTACTTGTTKGYCHAPWACTLNSVIAGLNVVCTGSTFIFDINKGSGVGTTMLSTKLSIDASEDTSLTAATAAVISVSSLAAGDRVTVDFDQVGATIAGAGPIVYLLVTRT